jgi:hypothetical protein
MTSEDKTPFSLVWKFGYALLCLAVFATFAASGHSDMGVVAGFSTAAIVLVARMRWDLRSRPWFWIYLFAIVLAHALLVWTWGVKIDVHPTILLAPFVIVDFAILMTGMFALARVMGEK